MVGLIGIEEDLHLKKVREELVLLHEDCVIFDLTKFGIEWFTGILYAENNITLSKDNSELNGIRSFWYRRRYESLIIENSNEYEKKYLSREHAYYIESLPLMLDNTFWLSNPHAIQRATYKPFNLKVALNTGFKLPRTLIGNNILNVAEMIIPEKLYAIKASQFGFISNENKVLNSIYTQKVTGQFILENISRIPICPITIQEYVPKAFELRITVVGKKIFACKIESQNSKNEQTKVDWRKYDIENTPHTEFELPYEIKMKCLELVRTLGLQFGCIDMVVTPDNEYYYLEINPNGQWLWIEEITGMKIGQAVAELLVDPESNKL